MSDDMTGTERWGVATIDLDAIGHNVAQLDRIAGNAEVWAVVKANAYGHGAVEVARAAVDAGASRLCVALVEEAVELRRAGITAPILILSQPPVDALATAAAEGVDLTVYDREFIDAAAAAAEVVGVTMRVHLHIDTGMSRVGASVADAADLARRVTERGSLALDGIMTHLACADDLSSVGPSEQLDRFDQARSALDAIGVHPPHHHVANSAGMLAHPRARGTAVRVGIAMYGIPPSDQLAEQCAGLRPALELRSRVSFAKRVPAGTRVSYGWRHECDRPTTLATVPLGYADGVPRRLGSAVDGTPGHDVLIGGRRHPIVGVVTMDQFVVDVGDHRVAAGDEVVLLGADGDDSIGPNDWARHLDTIGYEIVCGISARVPRSCRPQDR